MIFELQKNHVDQSLATGTKVPILLEFDSATAENGRGKHTYFATIDDAVNGIVSIVLEDNILGYQGRVDGSIYIELPDSRSLDTAGRFTFHIKRSPIDEEVPELEDYYWQGFSEINKEFVDMKKKLDKAIIDFGDEKNEIVQEFHRKFTEVDTALTDALTEFEKGNFYPKHEADDLFFSSEDLATKEEAENGEDNTKPMTPLRVFQAIAEWTKNKFVSITENQTILGTKNFQDGITFGDGSLLPAKRKLELSRKVYSATSEPDLLANGEIELQRDGNKVTCTFAFKPKTSLSDGAKIIWSLGEFEPEGKVRIPTCEGFCYLYNDPDDGNAIKIGKGLTKDQWASGTASWIAKNRI
ncbi:BppU family phage baseplate upper protein [Enterococcus pseudoavium]|uniref:BppU family phage baseplate upper protein n=1 Tax=Enterococcus pseudoavium TaxID=44007 RepID=UPI0035DFBFB1